MKDILGVPRSLAGDGERPVVKEKKEKMKRPEGMSREAFALLGDNHPIMPSQLLSGLKRKKDEKNKARPSTKGQPTYYMKAFTNQARSDGLVLRHWVKGYKDASGRVRDADEGEYKFAKYNKKVICVNDASLYRRTSVQLSLSPPAMSAHADSAPFCSSACLGHLPYPAAGWSAPGPLKLLQYMSALACCEMNC